MGVLAVFLNGLFFAFPLTTFAIVAKDWDTKVVTVAPSGTDFKDVAQDHPFAATITQLKAKGYIKGNPDGTFTPDNSVSRAEFMTMVMAALGVRATDTVSTGCFGDVKGHWSEKFVCSAKAKGYVSGYGDGTFKPNNNVSFAEASAIMAKAFALNPTKPAANVPWYKPAVVKMASKSAIPTSIDYLNKKISRAETGEMIWRLASKITNKPSKSYAALSTELPTIASCNELEEKFALLNYRSSKYRVAYSKGFAVPLMAPGMAEMDAVEESDGEESASAPSLSQSGESVDFSSTNVQVEGVDEADIIKNDGGFIYLVSGRGIRIVKAFPPEQMEEVAKQEFADKEFHPSDLYIAGSKLVVIGTTSAFDNEIRYGSQRTKVYIYSMDASRKLTEDRNVEFDGYQVSSRRIGNRVYLVMNDAPSMYHVLDQKLPIQKELPYFFDSKTGKDAPMVSCSQVRFSPYYDSAQYTIVASVDISDSSKPISKEVVMGAGDTVFSSLNNLYVASTRYEYPEVEKFDIWAPPLENQKTAILQFRLNEDGSVPYVSKGEVRGTLLNQFAMDEYGDNFRLATTSGRVWDTKQPSQNNLYVLDRNNLNTMVGKLENIAPGESIYSVRFMGKRAYLVTFKTIDPFFVIDLEDGANPKVLGELKVPGFSNYLHPFDENHIIGFGKEVDETIDADKVHSDNAVYYTAVQGMKIALFDVTDPTNPKMMYKEIIGDNGTDSELFNNHRALLFDKARSLFAFPVSVMKNAPGEYYGGKITFEGAYVYTLDLAKGFQLKGIITHQDNLDPVQSGGYYGTWSNNMIKRVVSIGDYLYSVSMGKIKATKREDMSEVKAVELSVDPNEPPYYGGPGRPIPFLE